MRTTRMRLQFRIRCNRPELRGLTKAAHTYQMSRFVQETEPECEYVYIFRNYQSCF